jgi:RNA polymerase sigma-70 factor (ECF subfamily)
VIQATAVVPTMSTNRSRTLLSVVGGQDRRNTSDGDLARALASGDAWAIAETWNRFSPMILMMAARTLGSESDAEDIAQEVFCRVFKKAKTLREPDALRSFVVSFGIRILKTELRRRKTKSWLSFHQSETLVDLSSETIDVESRDLLRRFYGLLDRLNARDRLAFALRHLESMTVEEVAESMELSTSTVKRALAHASERLEHWIERDPGLIGLLDGKGWCR